MLGQQKAFGGLDPGYIGFRLENVTLLLEAVEPGEFEGGRYLGFSLEVDDIEGFYSKLSSDIPFTGPPRQQVWGGIMTHVNDVSGNTLSIVQMLDDAGERT
ncbi:MAG: VOC family protein [Pseudomonadales bacterium]|nr:VOC family protein [Pseudomonadales bacterium]